MDPKDTNGKCCRIKGKVAEMKYYYSPEEIERQRKIDLEKRELMWDEIANEAGGGERGRAVSDAVRDLYSIYDGRLADWTANLYDKGWGSFYASPVGKDTEGFVPDLESTHQMFSFIEGSGMLDNFGRSCKAGLPDWMMPQIIYYAKSIQDPNGYFYHPHWSKTTADEQISHKSRDLYRCIYILRDYGDSNPVYDTPTDEKGDGVSPDEYWASLGLSICPPVYTFEYNKSKQLASKSQDYDGQKRNSDGSDYLRSHTAFIDYVTDSVIPRMMANPYSTGNEIGETAKQIKAYSDKLGTYKHEGANGDKYERFDGMTLTDISITCLNEIINDKTGLWGNLTPEKPLGTEFCYVNGFMKAMAAYNNWGYAYPTKYLEKVAHALMKCLLSDEESPGNICAVYNVWASICRFKQNIELNKDEAAKNNALSIVDGILMDKAPDALRNTKRKLEKYKKEDGGFGHSYTTGTPDHQGMPVSTGENASDVDATVIGADHILDYIFGALNMKKPPILMPSDWMRCRNILEAADPVKKTRKQTRVADMTLGSCRCVANIGAKISYAKGEPMKLTADAGRGANIRLTAKLWGEDTKIFGCTFAIPCDTEGKEYTLELAGHSGKVAAKLKLYAEGDKVYLLSPCGSTHLGAIGEKVGFTLRYKDVGNKSIVEIQANDDASTVYEIGECDGGGYPADAIVAVMLRATADNSTIHIYEASLYLGE